MRISLTAVAVVLMLTPAARSQVSYGGAQSLYIQPSARSAGLGHCTIALVDDASASSWNPGGLAFVEGDISATAVYGQLVPDWDDVFYWYGAGSVRAVDMITLAASVTYLSYGEQQATTPDDSNPFSTFHSYEVVPSVACGMAIGEHVGVGVNLKYVHVDLAPAEATVEGQQGSGSTFAADIGAELRAGRDIGELGLVFKAGGAVQHLGPDIAYIDEEQKDPLPRNVKLGASGQLSYGKAGHVLLCGQYERCLVGGLDNDISGIVGFGLELGGSFLGMASQMQESEGFGVRDLLALRLGYVYDDDGGIKDYSIGFGLGVETDDTILFRLDFAQVPQAKGLKRPWRIAGSGWLAF